MAMAVDSSSEDDEDLPSPSRGRAADVLAKYLKPDPGARSVACVLCSNSSKYLAPDQVCPLLDGSPGACLADVRL